jgi:uncharacterized membrane protein YccF (DUF307 family)
MSGIDVALGWVIIAVVAFAAYFGIPYLMVQLVRSVVASGEQNRLRREAIQEELDDRLRDEMIEWAEEEDRIAKAPSEDSA